MDSHLCITLIFIGVSHVDDVMPSLVSKETPQHLIFVSTVGWYKAIAAMNDFPTCSDIYKVMQVF